MHNDCFTRSIPVHAGPSCGSSICEMHCKNFSPLSCRAESGMREIVPCRTRSVEVGRRVDRESVRERVRVDELNVGRRVGDHLRVQRRNILNRPRKVAAVVCASKDEDACREEVGRVIDALRAYRESVSTCSSWVVWQLSDVNDLRVIFAVVVRQRHVWVTPVTPRHRRLGRLRHLRACVHVRWRMQVRCIFV